MTTTLPARCPAPVAQLPPRGSRQTGTFSMPLTGTFSVLIDRKDSTVSTSSKMDGPETFRGAKA